MKKQNRQGRKLALNKKAIAPLNPLRQNALVGGATNSACQITMVRELCQGATNEYGCTTHSLGIACTAIYCV